MGGCSAEEEGGKEGGGEYGAKVKLPGDHEEPLTLPMASVWCCVQICSLLTQCCLSLASVAEREKAASVKLLHQRRERADQYETRLMGGGDGKSGRGRFKRWNESERASERPCRPGRRPTPELVLLPADGVDREGVRVLVARGDDGAGQREHPAGLQGPRLLVDKVLQQALFIVQDEEPARATAERVNALLLLTDHHRIT